MYDSQEKIIKAASISNEVAIRSSIKHWVELYRLSPNRLIEIHRAGLKPIGADRCALCVRNRVLSEFNNKEDFRHSCGNCPLHMFDTGCMRKHSVYRRAEKAYCDFVQYADNIAIRYKYVRRFRRAAKILVKMLIELSVDDL